MPLFSPRRTLPLAASLLSLLSACSDATTAAPDRAREPVVGLPCEHCDWVFVAMPDDPPAVARIAPATEPGEPMRLTGVVRDAKGQPAPGIIIYAYHTDARGLYPQADARSAAAGIRHGRLRAWCTTDAEGRYTFETIRPGAYPNANEPQHVHMHVIEPQRCTYYIDDIVFDDDPKLTPAIRTRFQDRGGPGVTSPKRDSAGVWLVTRDIALGRNINGYL